MRATTAGLTKPLDAARGALGGFQKSVSAMGGGFGSVVGGLVSGFGSIGLAVNGVKSVVGGLQSVVGTPLTLAGNMEQLQVSMEVMLGSADKAKQVLGELTTFADATPFEFAQVAEAGKQLLNAGVSADQLQNKLKIVGDIASGSGKDFNELAQIYTKNMTAGIVQNDDLNQIANASIPIWESLQKVIGGDTQEIKKMASEGKISFADLDAAMKDLAQNKYLDMMDKQSKTTFGLFSTIKSKATTIMTDVGKAIIEAFNLKGAMSKIIGFIDKILPTIQGYLATISSTIQGWISNIDFSSIWNSLVAGWEWVKPIVMGVVKVFQATFSAVWQIVSAIGSGMARAWGALFGAFGEAIDKSGAKSGVAGFLDWVSSAIDSVTQTVIPWINSWYDTVVKGIEWSQPLITQYFNMVVAWWGYLKDAAIVAGEKIAEWWGILVNSAKKLFTTLTGYLPNFNEWRDTIVMGMVAIEFAFNNWYAVVELTVNKAILGIVRFANQCTYFFTDVIPAVFVWFRDNWKDILHDMIELGKTRFMNMSSNIVAIFKNLPGLLAGTVSFADIWTPLNEGAELHLKELPKIPERVMGDMEKQLTQDVDRMGKNLGKEWDKFSAKRWESLYPTETKLPEIKEFEPIEILDDKKTEKTIDKAIDGVKQIKRELNFAKLAEFGSEEARKSILANRFASSAKVVSPAAIPPTTTTSLGIVAEPPKPTAASPTPPTPPTAPTPTTTEDEDLGDVVLKLQRLVELLEQLPIKLARAIPQPETISI